jgi:diguanylate cyclase (GGDEF)-like protein/PAS domain S-box-containing protein
MALAEILATLHFLPTPPEASMLLDARHGPGWAVLALLIAAVASGVALQAVPNIAKASAGANRTLWIAAGALALGGGMWSMHFVALLGFEVRGGVTFAIGPLLVATLPGILGAAPALALLGRRRVGLGHLLGAALLIGLAAAMTHVAGMATPRFAGLLRYDLAWFALACVVAIPAAFAALWLFLGGHGLYFGRIPAWLVAGTVMGLGIWLAHQVMLGAAYFIGAQKAHGVDTVTPDVLAILVGAVALLIFGAALAAAFVSRSMRVAEQLRSSEQKVRRILETTQEGFVLISADNRIRDINQAFCAMLGVPGELLIGQSIFEYVDQAHRPLLADLLQRRGASEGLELEFMPPGGKRLQGLINATPLVDTAGGVLGAFALISDITGRRQHEAYMRQTVAVFENTAEGVMITDRQGRMLRVNPAFTQITGYKADEVLGKTPAMLHSGKHDKAFFAAMWAELNDGGHWQGEIWNRRKTGEVYPEWLTISAVRDGAGHIQNYVGVFTDISHVKRSEEELQRMAHYDALTELPNRTMLNAQLSMALERAHRNTRKLAVMELDLDGFKTVNDSLGHPAGDLLLQRISQRLKNVLRGEDVIARMGGDEFAIIVETPPSVTHLSHIAEKIIQVVSEPLDLHGHSAMVTASVGIAMYPEDGEDATSLLKAADTAMYAGKQAGRNTYRFHDTDMAKAARQRLTLELGLRRALEDNYLEVWYQPQIDLEDGAVIGAEALVRWRDPERGLISPADFVPVAEETGLILPLGEWVLRESCRQAQKWANSDIFMGTVSVNVSGPQIERGDFVATVRKALHDTRIDPKRLELEITESFLLRNAEQAMGIVETLSGLGIGVAIDDFGTGYSSLSYLKYLKAHKLKIDQRFVRDLPDDKDDAAIARAIIAMGLSLGFKVIAEGVETDAQQDFLKSEGCQQGQGYLYAKPLRAPDFEKWLAEHPRPRRNRLSLLT